MENNIRAALMIGSFMSPSSVAPGLSGMPHGIPYHLDKVTELLDSKDWAGALEYASNLKEKEEDGMIYLSYQDEPFW